MSTPIAGVPNRRRQEPLWDRVDRNRVLFGGILMLFAVAGTAWFSLLTLAFVVVLAGVGLVTEWNVLQAPLQALTASPWPEPAYRLWSLGLVVTLVYEWYALSRSERALLRHLGAKIVPKGDRLDSKMALKDMAIAAGMPVAPALYELSSSNANAFIAEAIGRRPVLGVTTGFLDKLSIEEQRAVFASLVARVRCGDTRVATALTALIAPLEHWRDAHEAQQNAVLDAEMLGYTAPEPPLAGIPLFGIPMVILGEIAAAVHRHSQLKVAEKADAEGMLLLREPGAMLSALRRCVELDNVVTSAGGAYAQLFYCWTGDSTNDDEDPEWRRVARLSEVLGVEGLTHT